MFTARAATLALSNICFQPFLKWSVSNPQPVGFEWSLQKCICAQFAHFCYHYDTQRRKSLMQQLDSSLYLIASTSTAIARLAIFINEPLPPDSEFSHISSVQLL